jgi:hypothetical protein
MLSQGSYWFEGCNVINESSLLKQFIKTATELDVLLQTCSHITEYFWYGAANQTFTGLCICSDARPIKVDKVSY